MFLCLLPTMLAEQVFVKDCSKLKVGQFICPDPTYDLIDPKTQQPRGCTKENLARGKSEFSIFFLE